MNALLATSGLEAFYGRSQALFGVSLEIRAGEVVTLLGRNGMGKTTTISSLIGLLAIARGQVVFKGERIDHFPAYARARLGLGLVPEGRRIFPNLSVRENLIATAANRQNRTGPWDLGRIMQLFPVLSERRNSMGNLLSGGEQQMLAIARALMTNPELLILDEATEGLAPLIRQEIWRVLSQLKEQGQAILVVDKNIADLTRLADRHFIIEKGVTVWHGTSSELVSEKNLAERYLSLRAPNTPQKNLA